MFTGCLSTSIAVAAACFLSSLVVCVGISNYPMMLKYSGIGVLTLILILLAGILWPIAFAMREVKSEF